MKKTLLVGLTCVDIMIKVPYFPTAGDDINISSSQMIAGGTSFNVSDVLRQMKIPYQLCSPVGRGIYGQFVEELLNRKGIPVFAKIPDRDNGCCYCIIDANSKHTFISDRGAEYSFSREWFKDLDITQVDSIYCSGLEFEDPTGEERAKWIEDIIEESRQKNNKLTFFFGPGPRCSHIDKNLLERLFALSPIVHINDDEVKALTGKDAVGQAAKIIHEKTNNHVIVTLGEKGSYVYDHEKQREYTLPGFRAAVIDTIGAGDAHLGTLIASLKQGRSLEESVMRANKYASEVVKVLGATLPDERFPAGF